MRRTTRVAIGALAGWVSVAIFANWSVILYVGGVAVAVGATPLALAFLCGAGLMAAAVIVRTKGDLSYTLTIGWALIGLIFGNLQRGNGLAAATSGVLLVVLGRLAMLIRRTTAILRLQEL